MCYRVTHDVLQGDPLLSDLPTAVTREEVSSQIALAHGQAMTVNVRRTDDQVLRECRHSMFLTFLRIQIISECGRGQCPKEVVSVITCHSRVSHHHLVLLLYLLSCDM